MLPFSPKNFTKILTAIDYLPLVKTITPPLNVVATWQELTVRRTGQSLALRCLAETETNIRPGWSEKKTAVFIRTWFADHGISDYFHRPLVFFGDRTRYQNFSGLKNLAPTPRILGENDVYILDVGPIIEGLACDVSITRSIGAVPEFNMANALLLQIRSELPDLVTRSRYDGIKVWNEVRSRIEGQGYDAIHQSSAYSFFGHRLNGTTGYPLANYLAKHGKQTYIEFFLRGLAGQLWSGLREASLFGIWAVEPHLGCPNFGVKFEEMLVVSPEYTGWLADLGAKISI